MVDSVRVVDIVGYSFSGKSAVYDLLSSFSNTTGHGVEFEFDLLRSRGGILDLEDSLVRNWGLVRSSVSIRDFRRLTYFLGGNGRLLDRIFRGGPQYGVKFANFDALSSDYVSELTIDCWEAYWPFLDFSEAPLVLLLNKYASKFYSRKNKVYLSRLDEDAFLKLTSKFLDRLVVAGLDTDSNVLLLNNCCDPSNPDSSLRLFSNAVSVVVDRDPRDIYLSTLNANNPEVGRAAIGSGIDTFISRFKVLRSSSAVDSPLVLRMSFEDLVLDYDNSKRRIVEHVGADLVGVEEPNRASFDPSKSASNVGQWKKNDVYNKYRGEIIKIEKELANYLTHY